LEFQTTMTKLTLISTFWLLTGAATVLGMPQDPTGQLKVSVNVNTGPKTVEPRQLNLRTGEDSTIDRKYRNSAFAEEQEQPERTTTRKPEGILWADLWGAK